MCVCVSLNLAFKSILRFEVKNFIATEIISLSLYAQLLLIYLITSNNGGCVITGVCPSVCLLMNSVTQNLGMDFLQIFGDCPYMLK